MFARRFFPARYFAPRYWPPVLSVSTWRDVVAFTVRIRRTATEAAGVRMLADLVARIRRTATAESEL